MKWEITKKKVFRIKGKYYTGLEVEGEDYCYIRSNPNGYYEFAKPSDVDSIDHLGRAKTKHAMIVFRADDFVNKHEFSEVIHYTAGWLAAEDGVEYTEVE